MLPSDTAWLKTPSPKYTSNFPVSTSCKKYTVLASVSSEMSVALVYVLVKVSLADVCTFTISVVVSALASSIINLCSSSELSTRYFDVIQVPS